MIEKILDLQQVTLCCVDSQYPGLGFDAIRKTCSEISFFEVLFFTNEDFILPSNSINNLKIITQPPILSIEGYSKFMLKELYKYIKTSHVLVIQWDGFVINPGSWQDAFLHYDYLGAPWPLKTGHKVGNGGFSLRSMKLLLALQDATIDPMHPEDVCICEKYGYYLNTVHEIQFPEPSFAERFSFEFCEPNLKSFGFHGMSNFPVIMQDKELTHFIEFMPAGLIFNGYFRSFLFNLLKLKNSEHVLQMRDRLIMEINRFESSLLLEVKMHNLIKTLCKVRFLREAQKLLKLRVSAQGWNFTNIKLAIRIFFS